MDSWRLSTLLWLVVALQFVEGVGELCLGNDGWTIRVCRAVLDKQNDSAEEKESIYTYERKFGPVAEKYLEWNLAWKPTWNPKLNPERLESVLEEGRQAAGEDQYAYYSPLRDLSPEVWSQGYIHEHRFLFTPKALSLEEVKKGDLVPCTKHAWMELVKEFYPQEYAGERKYIKDGRLTVWCFANDEGPDMRAMFFQETPDRKSWRVVPFNLKGVSGELDPLADLDAVLETAYKEGYLMPMPPYMLDRLLEFWKKR